MYKMLKRVALGAVLFAVFAAGFFSAGITQHLDNPDAHNSDIHRSHVGNKDVGIPKEGGQAAFAALAEIVAILDANPDTDWSRVNIAGLRDHLIDMNLLTLNAKVSINDLSDGAVFLVTGSGATLKAIHSMVPAHARELNKMSSWQAQIQMLPDGVRLSMTSKHKNVVMKIKGLGFFGLMATGAHHQPHHLGMARGTMAH